MRGKTTTIDPDPKPQEVHRLYRRNATPGMCEAAQALKGSTFEIKTLVYCISHVYLDDLHRLIVVGELVA